VVEQELSLFVLRQSLIERLERKVAQHLVGIMQEVEQRRAIAGSPDVARITSGLAPDPSIGRAQHRVQLLGEIDVRKQIDIRGIDSGLLQIVQQYQLDIRVVIIEQLSERRIRRLHMVNAKAHPLPRNKRFYSLVGI